MDWFFENLGKIVTFIIFIVYVLSSLKGAGGREEEENPEAVERARKIQEEIRRKILERQRGQSQPEEAEEREGHHRPRQADVWEPEEEELSPFRPVPSAPVERPEPAARRASAEPQPLPVEVYEDTFAAQRRQIEEQLRKAETLRTEAKRKAPAPAQIGSRRKERLGEIVVGGPLKQRVKARLRNRESLQEAIVVSEILDKPVGLR